jgi:hypothetical protein
MNCCRCPHSLASESSRRSRNPTVLLVGATSQMTMQHKYTDAGPESPPPQKRRERGNTRPLEKPIRQVQGWTSSHGKRRTGADQEAVVVRGNLTRLPLAPKARFKPTLYPFYPLSNLLKSRHFTYERGNSLLAFFLLLGLILLVQSLWAQDRSPSLAPAASSESAETASPDMQNPRQILPPEQTGTSSIGSPTKQSDAKSARQTMVPANQGPPEKQQPKRILGLMPNFRAVSAGAIPPPPTPKEAFTSRPGTASTTRHLSSWASLHSWLKEQVHTGRSGKVSPDLRDTTGAGLSTKRTAIIWLSLRCLRCSIRTNVITQWVQAVSGNAAFIQLLGL